MPDISQIVDSVADCIGRLSPPVRDFCRFRIAIASEFAKTVIVLPRGALCPHLKKDVLLLPYNARLTP